MIMVKSVELMSSNLLIFAVSHYEEALLWEVQGCSWPCISLFNALYLNWQLILSILRKGGKVRSYKSFIKT